MTSNLKHVALHGDNYLDPPHGGRGPSDQVIRATTQRYVEEELYASQTRTAKAARRSPVQVLEMDAARKAMRKSHAR